MFHKKSTSREITIADFEHSDVCPCCVSRRILLKTTLAVSAGLLLPSEWAKAATRRERMIKMYNSHTGENIRVVFWTPDYGYIQPALNEVTHFFRDFRMNKTLPVDIDLLNILHYMQSNIRQNAIIELHSGYRAPTTNAMLARRSKRVAKNSLHMKAQAADISVKGYSARQLRIIAQKLNAGGIGMYPNASFIHVDSGNVRKWGF